MEKLNKQLEEDRRGYRIKEHNSAESGKEIVLTDYRLN
jgi:hypothetical protein